MGEIDYFIQITGLALGASFAAAGITSLLTYRRQQRRRKEAPTLEDRITTLTENLKSFLSVISGIEAEVEKRREIAERLKKDVQRYEQLKKLSRAQVEAIAQTMRNEIAGESKKSIWRNAAITFAVALIFFFLGFFIRGT